MKRVRVRWELLVVLCLLATALWFGGRTARSVVRTSHGFERANPEDMFFYGLLTLYGSPHAPFLYHVHQVVGRQTVALWLPDECTRPDRFSTAAAWALAYDLQPAAVTCHRSRARYLLVFDRAPPPDPGTLISDDDANHALYRRA